MTLAAQWRALSPAQRSAFLACFLAWTFDAFDFFTLVFVIKDVAQTFHTDKSHIAVALTLTLAFRPVGAFLFGMAADRHGRRVPLMASVVAYSCAACLSGLAPTLTAFLILRALFGIAMGAEWGLGTSLVMETVPQEARGVLSGILQEGYCAGYLLAAGAYALLFPLLGWRGMFFLGLLPALLTLFIRSRVQESPDWERRRQQGREKAGSETFGGLIRRHGRLFAYLVLLMTALCWLAHGTQDLYPTFLQVQRGFNPHTVGAVAVIYNVGGLIGGVVVGALSQRIGRRRAVIGSALLALPIVPLWAFSHTAGMLAMAAFAMQFFVQGAWGVIPAHLSELAPGALRGTFIGMAYQLGNLFASANAILQTTIAERHGNDFSLALSSVVVVALAAVALVAGLGREARAARFGAGADDASV